MKNEKIITAVMTARARMNEYDAKRFDSVENMIIGGAARPDDIIAAGDPAHVLAAILFEARAELLNDNAKASGVGDIKKGVEKVLKNPAIVNPFLKKAYTINGRFTVCDGFSMYRLREAVEISPEFIGDEADAERVKGLSSLPDNVRGEAEIDLTIPSASSLTAFIKCEKAAKKAARDKSPVLYDFGDGLPAVNAEYLLNAIRVFGDGLTARAGKSPLKMIYIYHRSAATVLYAR